MRSLRNKPLLAVLCLVLWCFIIFSAFVAAECSCCVKKQYRCGCRENGHGTDSLIFTKGASHKNQCQCIGCGIPDSKDTLHKKLYRTSAEKKQLLCLYQEPSGKHLFPHSYVNTCFHRKTSSTFPPLFLLNSSFLF